MHVCDNLSLKGDAYIFRVNDNDWFIKNETQ